MTKSVGGGLVLLTNKYGDCSILAWISKTIQQVCKSVKSAETRSLDLGMEDSIFFARMLAELYYGKESKFSLPSHLKIYSKTLFDSIQSAKQVKEKSIRHIITWIKQQLEYKNITDVNWVCSSDMLAVIFAKKNVNSVALFDVMIKGQLDL